MEESKKRKLAGAEGVLEQPGEDNGELLALQSERHLRSLLDPLRKDQLVDLLVKLGMQTPVVAEEIRGVASTDPVHRKLFVRGLAWETTSETLCASFSIHGEIEEGAVIIDKATGKSRGYGFITYKNMESARNALEEPSKLIDGRLAVCNLACEGLTSASVSVDVALRKLYIGGLSPDTSSETLLNFFGKHGEIEEGSGRSITVKLADTQHKSRALHSQVPTAVVPIAIPIPAAYPQTGKSPSRSAAAPVTYAPYPYPYATHYSNAPPQSHIPYHDISGKKEQYGLHSASPSGISSYPYYFSRS
ncbi:Glycine-rich RNA-binding protein 4, mitochondrial [Apostasia shenzhenica]|uniref:Glycine-rich RNA-binding protein 4, mitochondrial n=1 Tax=Apostasia shenzhenica TaxID=1088818 RepID=A0A2H9ZVK3_9ASPA|nr:Glycine-rich RNA-binding protein 4, mitochondrial [Apostasia shenzhenica]